MTRKQRLKEIGSRLTQLREQLNYSRDKMAALCEVTESGLAKNERGDHLPQLDTLENLVKKFDASMDWLLFNKGPLFFKEKTHEEKPPVQQKQPEKQPGEKFLGLEHVMPDVNELLDYMAKDPLLKYEVLVFFYKYKKENN